MTIMDLATTDPAVLATWRAWRVERHAQFTEPHTWTSFSGLTWLTAEPAAITGTPGLWWTDGDAIVVKPGASDAEPLLLAGTAEPVASEAVFAQPANHTHRPLTYGGADGSRVVVELLYFTNPDGSVHRGVRPRDPDNHLVAIFAGIPAFDYDPTWVVDATVRYYDKPRPGIVSSEQPNLRFAVTIVGEIDLPLPSGDTATVHITSGAYRPTAHQFTFSDRADGIAQWRTFLFEADQVEVSSDGQTGSVRIDLNFLQNYPAGLAPHCFCPRELAEDRLEVAIMAGEQTPRR